VLPLELDITPEANDVTVEWGQVTNATSYSVSFSTNSDETGMFYTDTTAGTSYELTGELSPSTNYWVRVIPLNAGVEISGTSSGWVAFTTTA
jgi:hypothetical protein